MGNLSAAEHLKIARTLQFQGKEEEAINEYTLVLEIDPYNEEAAEGLRGLGVEPPSPSSFIYHSDEVPKMRTTFFVNQAKEGHLPAWRTGPFKVVILVLAGLAAWGVYTFAMMMMNFDNIKAAENVDCQIQKLKTKEDGTMVCEVKVANFNPGPVKNMVIAYELKDGSGNVIKEGKFKIETMIPAGDSRTFAGQNFGVINGRADKIHQKFESLVYEKPKKLREKVVDKFIDAAQKPDKETFSDFDEITNEDETFVPGLIGMGRAYAARGDYKRAIEQYKKALEFDPDNSNAHYHLAVAYSYNKQKDEAKKEIDKAATLAPDDPLITYSQKYLGTTSPSAEPAN